MSSFSENIWDIVTAVSVTVPLLVAYIFLPKINLPTNYIFVGLLISVMSILLISGLVSLGGECSFREALLLSKHGCRYLPFIKAGTISKIYSLSIILFLLLVVVKFKKIIKK
jgi:hypothetical protein